MTVSGEGASSRLLAPYVANADKAITPNPRSGVVEIDGLNGLSDLRIERTGCLLLPGYGHLRAFGPVGRARRLSRTTNGVLLIGSYK